VSCASVARISQRFTTVLLDLDVDALRADITEPLTILRYGSGAGAAAVTLTVCRSPSPVR
jgi:hypothetical protein